MEAIVMAQTTSHTVPQTTSLSTLRRQDAIPAPAEMRAGFDTVGGFELMQRGARLLSSSTIVPASYRRMVEKKVGGSVQMVENPSAMSNCVVALNMAQRMGADPLMIMQNLYIVEGRPAWSAQYIIASINACGKYSPLRFTIEDLGEKEAEYTHIKWEGQYPNRRRTETQVKTKIQDKRCVAWAIEKATGERLESPPVTIELAAKEGWFGKEGSKWQTMPDVMLRYRAASFFGKLYAPELLMGIQTAEEVYDTTYTVEPDETGAYQVITAEIRRPGENSETSETAPAALSPQTAPTTEGGAQHPAGRRKKSPAQDQPADIPAPEPEAQTASEPQTEKCFAERTYPCPRKDGMWADEEECFHCKEREGCPSHA